MSNFWDNLKHRLANLKQAKQFSEHPSEKDYEKYGTIEEDGKEKYPIRPGCEKDAEDALRLVHHEKDPEKREEIENAAHAEIEKDEAKKVEAALGPASIPGTCSGCKQPGVMTNFSRSINNPMCRDCTSKHPAFQRAMNNNNDNRGNYKDTTGEDFGATPPSGW